MEKYELHRPYILHHPPRREVYFPYDETDFEEFQAKMAVYTPFDEDRIRELDRWAKASEQQRGRVFYDMMSIVDAMRATVRPKSPLQVGFPIPYSISRHDSTI